MRVTGVARARLKAAMNRIDINGTATWLRSRSSIVFSFPYRRIGRQVPLYYCDQYVFELLPNDAFARTVGKELYSPSLSLCTTLLTEREIEWKKRAKKHR